MGDEGIPIAAILGDKYRVPSSPEWYGIPRTTDEATWSSSVGYSKEIVPMEKIMEGRKGEKSLELKDYDLEQRQLIDAEITKRSVDFIG